MTNVLGDALAAGIIAHVCEKDFAPKPPAVRTVCAGERGTRWFRTDSAQVLTANRLFSFCSKIQSATRTSFPPQRPLTRTPKTT